MIIQLKVSETINHSRANEILILFPSECVEGIHSSKTSPPARFLTLYGSIRRIVFYFAFVTVIIVTQTGRFVIIIITIIHLN